MYQFTPISSRTSVFSRFGVDISNCASAKEVADQFLAWEPATRPLTYLATDGKVTESKLAQSLYRDDTGEELAVVGMGYQPVTNRQLLLVAEQSGLGFGLLRQWDNGANVEVQMSAQTATIAGEPHRYYVSISDSKGSGSYSVRLHIENLVCLNGMVAMVIGHQWRTRHTKNVASRVSTEHARWTDVPKRLAKASEKMERLATARMRKDDCKKLIDVMFPASEETNRRTATLERIEALMSRISDNPDGHNHPGTLWTMAQAVTAHTQHDMDATVAQLLRGREFDRQADALELIYELASDDSRKTTTISMAAPSVSSDADLLASIIG